MQTAEMRHKIMEVFSSGRMYHSGLDELMAVQQSLTDRRGFEHLLSAEEQAERQNYTLSALG